MATGKKKPTPAGKSSAVPAAPRPTDAPSAPTVAPVNPLHLGLLAAATIAVILPFIGRALHVDDPLWVWAVERLQQFPKDPWGYSVNWQGVPELAFKITNQPPLNAYFLFAVSKLFGVNPVAFHLALLPANVLSIVGTYLLARKFTDKPWQVAAIVLLSPAFLVSATTLMADSLFFCFWMWTIVFWVYALDAPLGRRVPLFAAAAGCLVLCSLTRYNGVGLLPLLIVYTLHYAKKIKPWMLALLVVPIIVFVIFQVLFQTLGQFQFLTAIVNSSTSAGFKSAPRKTFIGLAYLGASVTGLLFLAPFIWSRTTLVLGFGAAFVVGLTAYPALQPDPVAGKLWYVSLQFGLWAVVGGTVFWLGYRAIRENFDSLNLLLVLWMAGVFVFASYLNWTVNARSVLPIVPAAAILVIRALNAPRREQPVVAPGLARWAFVPMAALALAVTWADYSFANASKQAADIVREKFVGKVPTTYFLGHWGWQYYLEKSGARPINVGYTRIVPKDIVVKPPINVKFAGSLEYFDELEKITVPSCGWLATSDLKLGAGFFSDFHGPLPYSFGPATPASFRVFSSTRNLVLVDKEMAKSFQ